jgi:hypothetical protein
VIGDIEMLCKMKINIIQEMTQIEQPVSWLIKRITKIATEIKILNFITQP